MDNDVTVAAQTLVEGDLEVDLTITRTSYNIGVELKATYKGQDVTESIGELLAAWEAEADGDGLTAAEKASIEAVDWAAGLVSNVASFDLEMVVVKYGYHLAEKLTYS